MIGYRQNEKNLKYESEFYLKFKQKKHIGLNEGLKQTEEYQKLILPKMTRQGIQGEGLRDLIGWSFDGDSCEIMIREKLKFAQF